VKTARNSISKWPGQLDDTRKTIEIQPFTPAKLTMTEETLNVHLLRLPFSYSNLADDLDTLMGRLDASSTLVIDLRGNALGDMAMFNQLAQRFLPSGQLARWEDVNKKHYPITNSKGSTYAGKLYVIIDHTTSRTAEIFAALGRETKALRLVGERTLGLPFWYELLPLKTGGHVRLSTRDLVMGDQRLTGSGVRPHLKVDEEKGSENTSAQFLKAALVAIQQDDGRDDGIEKEETVENTGEDDIPENE